MRQYFPAFEGLAILALTLPLALWQPAFWLLAPFAVLVAAKRSFADYALGWHLGPLRLHLVLVPVILGGYTVAHYAYGRLLQGASFHPQLPPDLHLLAVHQLLDVALPEEVFFRGYLQTRLNHAFGRPLTAFGARWGLGLPLAAILFALCHLVFGDVTQLKVFFFGVFAGWLRERTDSVVAPILYHAAGNILLEIMALGFRS